tara:strand:+ start:143 stop:814 length:672 start_codon:yes stop_codon:yes gene_type:complete
MIKSIFKFIVNGIKITLILFACLYLYFLFQEINRVPNSENTTTSSEKSYEDNLGDWKIGNFVDEFGDKTKSKFLLNNATSASFSNTATEKSKLKVKLYLDASTDGEKPYTIPWFRLYEYARSNPVKGYYSKGHQYFCRIKGAGEIFEISLYLNDGDDFMRLNKSGNPGLSPANVQGGNKLIDIIKDGGVAKFSCFDYDRTSTTYRFDFDFSFYKNALSKLDEI